MTKRKIQLAARAEGLKVFQAHCKACNAITEHYTSSGACKACKTRKNPPVGRRERILTPREYQQAYHAANRERLNRKKRKDYHQNIEISRLINRLRYQARKERAHLTE